MRVVEVKSKIPDIINLATKAALTTNDTEIWNKIPDAADFFSNTRVDFIIKDVHSIQKEIKTLKKFKNLGFRLSKNCLWMMNCKFI